MNIRINDFLTIEGTPTTLIHAIKNGIDSTHSNSPAVIRDHVKDYLAQKFGAAMIAKDCDVYRYNLLKELFDKITEGDV